MSKSRHHEGDQPLSTTINEKKASAIIPRQLTKVVPSGKDIKTLFTFIRLLFSLNYTKIDILLLVVGTFFAIAAGVPEPLLGIVLGQLINELNTVSCSVAEYDASSVRTKVLYLIYITIFNFFSIYIYAACWGLFSERLARRYRKTYFRSVIRQEAAFHDSLSSGDIMSRLVNDIETVQSGTSEKLGIYIATLSYFVTAYIVAFIKVPLIAGILIAIVPCFFAMSLVGGYFASKFGSRVGKHVENATSIASSSLSHLKIVHAFNAHERLEESFSAHLSRAQKDALKKAVVHATQMGTLFFIAYSSNALAYWKGAHLIADSVEGKNSGVSVGAVYTIIFILIDASFILSQVSPYIHVFSAAASASKRLLEVINRSSEIDGTSEQGEKNAVFGNGDIIFQDVHFTYPSRPQNPILGGVSFRIPAKKHTAIVGPSGGGKSTIVALLERFYDPTSGDIYTGSESFRSLNVSYLRGQMGFVQQEPLLLDRSVLENIAYGLVGSSHHQHLASAILGMRIAEFAKQIQSGSSEEEMLASCDSDIVEIIRRAKDAASQANALSFIEALPFGIATRVGPSGSQLSGGQKQRIALASALVREPKLLILDEATAALDSTSEKLIQEALLKVSETITTVSIAHRLATAKDAHQVVVIQKGQVVEHGSPRDLLDQDGVYAHMVGLQKLDNEGNDREEKVSGDEFEIISTADDKSLIPEAVRDEKQKDLYPIDESKGEKPPGTTTLSVQENKILPRMKWLTTKVAFAFIRPNILLVILGLAMSVIIGASYSSNAVLFGYTVAGLSTCKSAVSIRDSGDLYGLLFFIVGLVEFFANVIGGYAFGWAADQMLYRIRTVSFRSLLSQSITWHSTNGRSPGILLSYITSDASAISGITGSTIGLLLATTVNLFAGIIISFAFAWKIAIVLVPTIPILLFAGVMKLRVQSQFAERHKKAFSQATEITMEALDNVRVVSSFSLEKQLYQEYLHSLRAPYQEILKAVTVGNFWLALAFSISHLISALAYWWGSRQIASGLYTQTQFFIVLPALLFSTQSCGQMLALAPDISKAGNAASHIATLVNTNSVEGEIDSDAEDAQLTVPIKPGFDLEASKGFDSSPNKELYSPMGVELQKVHFSYPNRSKFPVLNGLSLKIEPGRFYALVGPSGCGKSTTFAMLERFYYPSSGSVIIDGQDITRISSASFRDEIALVPQENILFEGTVSFNIGLGTRPGYTPKQAEIEEACKLSNIHDVIMELPQGYETICSHGGKQFSGGQRQRLSIARALVRKPRLLLLDESTSALDVDSERKIQEAIANLGGNTTIIAIAHRLSTIYRADQIFLIEEGQCVDQGTHLELLDRSKTYQDSVLHQSFES